nr:hypothetical protein Iba_chr13cCG17660 [Ipomoea batatas]
MGPENEFPEKLSSTSLLSFIIEAGIGPLKWQYERSIWDSSLRFPMDSGKFPENIVHRSVRLLRDPFSGKSGNEPPGISLELKSMVCRVVRLVKSVKKSGNGAEKLTPSSLITESDGSLCKRETLKPAVIE